MNDLVWGDPLSEPSGKSEKKDSPSIEAVSNHIYFYSHVDTNEVLQLNRKIREVDNSLLHEAIVQGRDPASIFLHINSYGGRIFDGLAAMDTVLGCRVPVVTIIDGCCASAATFISVVGKMRLIHEHSFMMIHQLSGLTWGKFRDIQDDVTSFTKFMDSIKAIYAKYTSIPVKKIEEILDHDLWIDAKTCVEYGLVDRIISQGGNNDR